MILSSRQKEGFIYIPEIMVKNNIVSNIEMAKALIDNEVVKIHGMYRIKGKKEVIALNETLVKGDYWINQRFKNYTINCGRVYGSRKVKMI